MDLNAKFLEAYKALEAELKYDNKTVLEYEVTLKGQNIEKLKCCRIMRNYMAHNDLEFLSASNNQIKFLNDMIADVKKTAQIVKNATKKIALLKESTAIKDIAVVVNKSKYAPIQTSSGIYLVNSDILVSSIVNNEKKVRIPAKLPKYKYISPSVRLSDVETDNVYIVTSDGTIKGKYIGLLIV